MNCLKHMTVFSAGMLLGFHGLTQAVHLAAASAYIGAGAYSTQYLNAFSFVSNPSALGGIQSLQSGVLIERKWMLKELDLCMLTAAVPFGNGGVGISLQQTGDADYHERSAKLGYGKNLGRLEAGIDFNYLQTKASGYQGNGFTSAGAGIRAHVSEKFITGLYISMAILGKAGKQFPESGPAHIEMAFGYELRDDLFLAIQIIKLSGAPVNVVGAVEYRYGSHFFFSVGFNSLEGLPYFKSGFKKNNLSIQLYAVYQSVLGFSPGLMLLWESQQKKK